MINNIIDDINLYISQKLCSTLLINYYQNFFIFANDNWYKLYKVKLECVIINNKLIF